MLQELDSLELLQTPKRPSPRALHAADLSKLVYLSCVVKVHRLSHAILHAIMHQRLRLKGWAIWASKMKWSAHAHSTSSSLTCQRSDV